MGRPTKDTKFKNPYPTSGHHGLDDGASMSSAISLQEDILPAEQNFEDELERDDTLPPPYTDDESAPLTTNTSLIPDVSAQAPDTLDENIEFWCNEDWRGTTYTRLSPTLTTDPVALEQYIRWEASRVPKAYVRVQGYHSETRRDRDGKSKRSERVDDFDFKANVGDTFTNGPAVKYGRQWKATVTVDNLTKAYRGTRLKTRSTFKPRAQEPEAQHEPPSLKEWCHLFCASSTPLKTFTLRRIVAGRDTNYITEQVTDMLRATNYRGNITVTYPIQDRSVTIISPHTINRLRHHKFVWWACIILQLWVITWPILFLMTKRWEVVRGEYYFMVENAGPDKPARFWKESEAQWCSRWKDTIQESALRRVKKPNGAEVTVLVDSEEERQRRQAEEQFRRNSEQQNSFVGGALALLRGASNVHRDMNTSLGWGYDS